MESSRGNLPPRSETRLGGWTCVFRRPRVRSIEERILELRRDKREDRDSEEELMESLLE